MKPYPFLVKPLASEDGGGFMVEYPDLPGCMSDGETVEEAIAAGHDAIAAWIETAEALGRPIPEPNMVTVAPDYSGKFVQRLPKSLHAELSERAKSEGVSINALVLSYIAKGVGFVPDGTDGHHI